MKIGFIGLGLIGGSVAKAIRKNHNDYTIIAYDIYGKVLDAAINDGTINEGCYEIDNRFDDCDYIFLCAPVNDNEKILTDILTHVSKDCILTDVGSVKGNIHRALSNIGFDGIFIGGHPMAGSEKYGYEHSSENVIKNAYYILTPGINATEEKINQYSELISSIGCKPTILTEQLHDKATGVISHIPHVISSSLVHFLMNHDDENQNMKVLAAGGFRDITRTASSSVKMWEDICIANNDVICDLLDDYIRELEDVKATLKSKDKGEIAKFFSEAKQYRDFLY